MNKQTITEEYLQHIIEVKLEGVLQVEFIPDEVKYVIFNELSDSTEGEFTVEETGCYAGTWRILQLSHELMFRIAKWAYNRHLDEKLTEELFIEHFGASDGKHFFSKWEYNYNHNFFNMITYFAANDPNGKVFCNMIMKMVEKYEKRLINKS